MGCRNKCLQSRRHWMFSPTHLATEISPTERKQVLPSLSAREGDITVFRVTSVPLPTQLPFFKSRWREKMFPFHLLNRAWWAHEQETSTFKGWTRLKADCPGHLCFLQQLPWNEAHSAKLIFTSFHSSLSGKVVASGCGWPVSNPPELQQSQIIGTCQMRQGQPNRRVGEVAAYIFLLPVLSNITSKMNCLKIALKYSGKSRQTPFVPPDPQLKRGPKSHFQGRDWPDPNKAMAKLPIYCSSDLTEFRVLFLTTTSHPVLQRWYPPTHVDIVLQKACVFFFFLLCW